MTEFAVGDRVFGALPYLALTAGAHAEYICVPERFPLTQMPAGMSFEEAGAIGDGVLLTLNGLRPAQPLEGKRILVYGASGSIGTAAVQLAKHFGAHVTARLQHAERRPRALARRRRGDRLPAGRLHENRETYDVIFDAVGRHSFRRCKRALKPGGVYLPTDGLRNIPLWLLHKRSATRRWCSSCRRACARRTSSS